MQITEVFKLNAITKFFAKKSRRLPGKLHCLNFVFSAENENPWSSLPRLRSLDNVSGAVRTCFDHVLSKLSGFSWERILFLKSACVNMAMQIQVQIGDTRRVFFMNPPGSIEDLKKLHFA